MVCEDEDFVHIRHVFWLKRRELWIRILGQITITDLGSDSSPRALRLRRLDEELCCIETLLSLRHVLEKKEWKKGYDKYVRVTRIPVSIFTDEVAAKQLHALQLSLVQDLESQ